MLNLNDLVAGGVSGAASRMVIAPLDVIKIRLQLESCPRQKIRVLSGTWSMFKTVYQEERLISLYRGNCAAMSLWVFYTATQFSIHGAMSRSLEALGPGNSKSFNQFVAGGVAGAGATVFTYPLDVLRTAFAAQGIPRRFETMRTLVAFELSTLGIRGLYVGISPALAQIIPHTGLTFVFYEAFKNAGCWFNQWLQPFHPDTDILSIRPNNQVVCVCTPYFAGFASGFLSKIIVFPCDTIKKRMQAAAVLPHRYGAATWKIDMKWNQRNILTLYQGLIPTCLKAGIASGVTFGVYDWTKVTMENMYCT